MTPAVVRTVEERDVRRPTSVPRPELRRRRRERRLVLALGVTVLALLVGLVVLVLGYRHQGRTTGPLGMSRPSASIEPPLTTPPLPTEVHVTDQAA